MFQRGKAFYIEYTLRCFLYLLTSKWEAVYAVDLDSLPAALLAARIKGKPCIYDAHEWFSETPEVERRPMIRRIWRLVGQLTVHRADATITVGPALAQALHAEYGKSFEVIRNVPFHRPLPSQIEEKDPSRPILLYQGVLNEGRGLESIIRAMKTLPEARLWLAGEGDCSAQLRKIAHQEGISERVQFLGLLQPEELYKITHQATIGINLLERRSKSYYLSLANKAFDYIHAGLPAIHMDFPEYRALNTPTPVAHLVADLQPETIANSIRKYIDHPADYHRIRENCLRKAATVTWEKESKVLEKIIDRILNANI